MERRQYRQRLSYCCLHLRGVVVFAVPLPERNEQAGERLRNLVSLSIEVLEVYVLRGRHLASAASRYKNELLSLAFFRGVCEVVALRASWLRFGNFLEELRRIGEHLVFLQREGKHLVSGLVVEYSDDLRLKLEVVKSLVLQEGHYLLVLSEG